MKHNHLLLAIMVWFAVLATVGTLMHIDLIDRRQLDSQHTLHRAIVNHTASPPNRYRILQPTLVNYVLELSQTQPESGTYKFLFLYTYAGIRFLSIFTTLVAVYLSLKLFWPHSTALLGSTFLASLLPFTYRYYYFHPSSVLEMALFGVGLFATLSRKPFLLFSLVAIGTFNRETMCFLPFAYFLYWFPKLTKREWTWLLCSAAAWILVFGGLRILWPVPGNLPDVSSHVWHNLTFLRGNIDILVILSPSVLFLLGLKRIPVPFWRLALCSIPWVALHYLASNWWEIRYYMPLLIWLLPGLMFTISGETFNNDRQREIEQLN